MSCLLGAFNRDQCPIDVSEIEGPLGQLSSQGVDQVISKSNDSVVFGSRLMAFSPEDHFGDQLKYVECSDLLVVANARLTNREDLTVLLGLDSGLACSELIGLAYRRWGTRCTRYLDGEFAFALFDGKKKRLFCARDHFGISPFYYHLSNKKFIFASSIKGMLAFSAVSKDYNYEYIIHYLTSTFFNPSITFYNDISALPAGHQLVVSEAHFSIEAYWGPARDETIKHTRDSDVNRFRDLLSCSVKRATSSLTPVSISLSGGLDSGAVAGFAATHLKEVDLDLHALTYRTLGSDYNQSLNRNFDETEYAKMVADYHSNIRFHSHEIVCDKWSIQEFFNVCEHFQSPCRSAFLTYRTHSLSQLLQHIGSRVSLDGLGGNFLVSPGADAYYLQLMKDRQYLTLVNELWNRRQVYREPYSVIFKRYIVNALRKKPYALDKSYLNSELIQSNLDFVRVLENDLLDNIAASISPDKYTMFGYFRPRLQKSFEDAAEYKTFNNIDGRQPLWDRKLVEFCLQSPLNHNVSKGWDRTLIREATIGVLPGSVRWRTTRGYGVPDLPRWFYQHTLAISQELKRIENSKVAAQLIDIKKLRDLHRELKNGWNNRLAHRLLHFMTLGSFVAWQEGVG